MIDLAKKQTVTSFEVPPRPRSIAFLPNGTRAYVTSENGAALSLVDVDRHVVMQTIPLGDGIRPMGVVSSRDGSRVYVSTGRSRSVLAVDTATNQVIWSVEAGPRPWGIAVSADGSTLYTANGSSNDVSVIDVASRQVVAKIPVGEGPWGVSLIE